MAERPELSQHPPSMFSGNMNTTSSTSALPHHQLSEAFVSSILSTAARQAVNTYDRDESDFNPPAMVATFRVSSFVGVRPPLGGGGRAQIPSPRSFQNTNDFRAEERYLVPPSSASSSGTGAPYVTRYANENAPLNTPTRTATIEEITPRHTKQSPRVPLGSRSGNLIVSWVSGSLVKKEMRRKDEEIAMLKAQLERIMSADDAGGEKPDTVSANGMSTPVQTALKLDFDEEDDLDNECPMCMSPLKRKKGDGANDDPKRYTVIMHCGHRFHLDYLSPLDHQSRRSCRLAVLATLLFGGCRLLLILVRPVPKNKGANALPVPSQPPVNEDSGRAPAHLVPLLLNELENVADDALGEGDEVGAGLHVDRSPRDVVHELVGEASGVGKNHVTVAPVVLEEVALVELNVLVRRRVQHGLQASRLFVLLLDVVREAGEVFQQL